MTEGSTIWQKLIRFSLPMIAGNLLQHFRGINKPYISLILTVISLGTRVALSYALAPHTPFGVMASLG